ncbi:hypothetical protein C2I36_09570 [Rhodobacteraceae bacterium WD3A24]|nr:hypothetical protein C2I36_09570 [Rhodobacteraceae bacterium WD3A24]
MAGATTLEPGVQRLDAAVYHADPAPEPSLSSSIARLLLNKSPRHAWVASPRLNPDWEPVEKKHFDVGRAAHRAVLGAGEDYAVIPEGLLAANGAASTKEAKAYMAEAREMGLTPIKPEEGENVESMAAAAHQRLRDMGITLDPATSEVTALAWIDGVWCRAMVDNAPADRPWLIDFKTTTDASPEAAMRTVMNYGYDVQAAHYLATWKAATGEDRDFLFLFQEKEEPFEVSLVRLVPNTLVMGEKKIRRAREIWRLCLRDDQWPGYPLGIHDIDLPEFFHAKWLERESREADHKSRTGQDVIEAAMRWQAPEATAGE